jgi:hypothetical protein
MRCKKLFKFFLYVLPGIGGLTAILLIAFNVYYYLLTRSAKSILFEKQELNTDGITFRDLNNNGKPDA